MKTIVNSWHDGISGPRLAPQFKAESSHLRDDDGSNPDNPEDVRRVVALATKENKATKVQLATKV